MTTTLRQQQLLYLALDHIRPGNTPIAINKLKRILSVTLGIKYSADDINAALLKHEFKVHDNDTVSVAESSSLLRFADDRPFRIILRWLVGLYRNSEVDLSQVETPAGMGQRYAQEAILEVKQYGADKIRKNCESSARWRGKQDPVQLKARQREWEAMYRRRLKGNYPQLLKIYNNGQSVKAYKAEQGVHNAR